MTQDIPTALVRAQQAFKAGHFDEAERWLLPILERMPEHGEALEGLAYLCAKRGDVTQAADYMVRRCRQGVMSLEQGLSAARIFHAARRYQDAVACYERNLAQAPNDISSLHGMAVSLMPLGDFLRALSLSERLCVLRPRSAEVHYNRGTVLGALGRYDEEMAAYRLALEIQPRFVPAYVNLGVVLSDLRRTDEALAQFKKALQIDPNDVGARTNRARTNLLIGEFEHGWREYEWRWKDGGEAHGFPAHQLWLGAQPVAGKTVLVHHEQGLGDTLQFVRFVDKLVEAGARVVLRVQDELWPLLRDYPGVAQVLGATSPLPPFDFHIPLMSLPFAFKLGAADLIVRHPYLEVAPEYVARWNDILPPRTGRPRVGIVWSGSPTQLNDHNRSIALAQCLSLFDAEVEFISLQKVIRETDQACAAELMQRGVLRDVAPHLHSFADTAGLIAHLDLVIGVDTSVVHLAGALGKPVWVMAAWKADWRWHLQRTDSPWYPSARLFRQTTRGDWAPVMAALRAALDLPDQAMLKIA